MNLRIVEFAERGAGLMWEASATASVLAVLAGLIGWALRKRLGPSWRFALWGIVLVRLLLPMTPESSMSLFNLGRMVEAQEAERPAMAPAALAPALDDSLMGGELEVGELSQGTIGEQAQRHLDWRGVLALGWLAGAVLLGAKLMLGAGWLRWRVARESDGAGEKLEGIWAAAAREMGVRTRSRVVLTDLVNGPALFGIWRPQLLFPRNLAETLDERQLRHVFLHELAHLKRRDLLTNGCMAGAQVLHWWNPVVWFVLGRMRLERELACDEMVLRLTSIGVRGETAGRAYGETILQLVEGANGGNRVPALVGIAEEKKAVRTRLEQIAAYGVRPKTGRILGALLVLILAAVGLTGAQERRELRSELADAAEKQSSVVRWLDEAKGLIEQKRWDDAAALLRQAIQAAPQHKEANELLTMVRNEQFKTEAKQSREDGKSQERSDTDPAGVRTLVPEQKERSGTGRRALLQKLNEIVIDHYEVPNALPLTEIIKDIHFKARKLDPKNSGVNFIISSQLENPGLVEGSGGAGVKDENGRKPLKVGDYRVTISPALREVTLLDLVNAIVEVAVPPEGHEGAPGLRYWVEDYAVVFGQRLKEKTQLYTRTYRVDPNTFVQGLNVDFANIPPGDDAARTAAIQQGMRTLLERAGIDFDVSKTQPGVLPQSQKAFFFNDQRGVLFARSTLRELNLVESALQALQASEVHQMTFTVEAVEVRGKGELERLAGAMGLREFRTALTSLEYRTFRAKKGIAEMQWMKLPRMTTLSGRPVRAEIEGSVGVDVVADYEKGEKKLRVRASSFGDNAAHSSSKKDRVIYDGQTFVVLPDIKGQTVTPTRVVFITVNVVDAAGNFVNTDDAFLERTNAEVP